MTDRIILEAIFDDILKATAGILKPLGYRRERAIFRRVDQGVCELVDFQRSGTRSSGERIVFTVNLGVVCGDLLGSGPSGLQKAHITDAHLRRRIGSFLPDPQDKWWEVTVATDRGALIHELQEPLLKRAVPYIEHFLSPNALIALWESGESPGLTELQRVQFLLRLKEAESHRVVDG
jgi:hypothetical protein